MASREKFKNFHEIIKEKGKIKWRAQFIH
jgi:hypothetical protein